MMDSRDQEIEAVFDALDQSMVDTTTVVQHFQRTLNDTRRSAERSRGAVTALDRSISSDLRGAMTDVVFEGARASDAIRAVAQSLAQTVFQQSITPLTNAVGGAIGGVLTSAFTGGVTTAAFANGGSFTSGRVRAFANGGVVSGPTTFPMRGGQTGLMGEAGPEAIMPLTRRADGSLGVRMEGGAARAPQVNVHIQTNDVESFKRSRSQIAAALGRAVGAGQRNV